MCATKLGTNTARAALDSLLTPAELLVVAHLVQGLSNKEIATLLGRSEATIKNQIGSILSKTGVPTRTRFIACYYQQFFCVLASAPAPSADPIAPLGRSTAANLHSREARHVPPAGGTRSLREATPFASSFVHCVAQNRCRMRPTRRHPSARANGSGMRSPFLRQRPVFSPQPQPKP